MINDLRYDQGSVIKVSQYASCARLFNLFCMRLSPNVSSDAVSFSDQKSKHGPSNQARANNKNFLTRRNVAWIYKAPVLDL